MGEIVARKQCLYDFIRAAHQTYPATGFIEVLSSLERSVQRCFLLSAFHDVAENQNYPDDRAAVIPDRRAAVVDRDFRPVFGDQDRVVHQPDDGMFAHDFRYRVFLRFARCFVDNLENIL